MPFGKHLGLELAEIPDQYLRWLRSQPWLNPPLAQEVERVLSGTTDGPEQETDESGDLLSAFSVHSSDGAGQTIVDVNGEIIAETTDPWVAQVICRLLNENEELLFDRNGEMT